LSQPVGHNPAKPDYMYDAGKTSGQGAARTQTRRLDGSNREISARPLPHAADFVYSVSRDFAKSCQTSMLVLPDNVDAHPLVTSIDVASLCPNAEITVFPGRRSRR